MILEDGLKLRAVRWNEGQEAHVVGFSYHGTGSRTTSIVVSMENAALSAIPWALATWDDGTQHMLNLSTVDCDIDLMEA